MSIQMSLIPFYCSDSILKMFIEQYKARMDYIKWLDSISERRACNEDLL